MHDKYKMIKIEKIERGVYWSPRGKVVSGRYEASSVNKNIYEKDKMIKRGGGLFHCSESALLQRLEKL